MARNVEIKARVRDVAALIERAAAIADSGPERIEQDDTFFACTNGRLKLRQFSPERGELIHYFRANSAGPPTHRAAYRCSRPSRADEPAASRDR